MKTPIIETTNLVLKPLNTSYVSDTYVQWMNDPDVIVYLESGGDYTIDMLKGQIFCSGPLP